MKLEVKSVKLHPQLSEETNCFSATLYADGKKVAQVSNDGHGGGHRYRWTDYQIAQEVEAFAQTQYTEYSFEKLDQLVDKLLQTYDAIQQLKRRTKKTTYFRLKEDPDDGQFRTVNAPFSPQVGKYLTDKYGAQLHLIVNKDLEAALPFCR